MRADAASLFTETFGSAQPGSAYTGAIPNTGFTVTSGSVDIIGPLTNGAASGFYNCAAPNSGTANCLDLNGNQPGAITTDSGFNLTAGTSYTLSFNLAGSVPVTSYYQMQATIGDSAPFVFSVPAGNAFGTETVTYTPATNQPNAHISFASDTDVPGNAEYGALISDVTFGAAAANSSAMLIYSQTLATAAPGANYKGALSNTGLTVTSGDVDIFGNGTGSGTAGFYTCPPPLTASQTCIDLNGDQPGIVQTDQIFNLTAGSTYTVSFQLAGNIPNGDLSEYTLQASFGNSGPFTFSVPPDAPFQTETFSYTPSVDETGARLILASQQTSDSLSYGPIVTDLSITDPPGPLVTSDAAAAVPEPESLFILLVGLVSLTVLARRSG